MSPSFVSTFLTFGVFVSAYSKSDSAVNPLGRDTSNTTMFDCFSIVSSSFGLKLENGKIEATDSVLLRIYLTSRIFPSSNVHLSIYLLAVASL